MIDVSPSSEWYMRLERTFWSKEGLVQIFEDKTHRRGIVHGMMYIHHKRSGIQFLDMI
jgi:hypothetical protein